MKRNEVWNKLKSDASNKRKRQGEVRKVKGSTSPHELIVQRLSSEPDNKQTFKAIQPREFVQYDYEEFTLANLKKACAAHFGMPATTCDILVSSKGPSCSNIAQIPHRKDKVYLVRFVIQKDQPNDADEQEYEYTSDSEQDNDKSFSSIPAPRSTPVHVKATTHKPSSFPASVSIASLLNAGKLVKPVPKTKVTLTFEKFELSTKLWVDIPEKQVSVETMKFSSGACREAFHVTSCQSTDRWVLKTYNTKTIETIQKDLNSTVEDHCRKQVQLHAVARQLTDVFKVKAPKEFGKCFTYNECYFTSYNGNPATIEEFVPGTFAKLVNNDGECMAREEDARPEVKQLYEKAQCLVHFSYEYSNEKLMLTDIQGSRYCLYDPEVATLDIMDGKSDEIYFCSGNCSTVGIETFFKCHVCNEFCRMMGLKAKISE